MKGKLIDTSKQKWIHVRKCTNCGSRKDLDFDVEMVIETYLHEDGSRYKIIKTMEVCPRCSVVDWHKKTI
jgi:ribosomal protein S27AE